MHTSTQRVFITDCEGPITKNDNAAELSEAYIPDGHRFFAKISLYDDYLAEIAHKPGYKAGDTLRLILPFFKAFGLTDDLMVRFSADNVHIVPGADEALREISSFMPAYIVSTSYAPYIRAVCAALGFPYENTYRTEVSLDAVEMDEAERARLRDIHRRILALPHFTLPPDAAPDATRSSQTHEAISSLDEIFWNEMTKFSSYRLVLETNPIGGPEKARAVREISAKLGVSISDVMYVGDSVTDVDAFRLVRSEGGAAVSFNGNDWAVREASYAITSLCAAPTGFIARLFRSGGVEALRDLFIGEVAHEDVDGLSKRSSRVRKEVRSEKIGALG
jgi:predicted HAD superfamily phosphohydrolase